MVNCEMTMRERRLYEASLGGDITSLMELLKEDPLILERVITSFTETPLHIAAMYGHIDFANELLRRKPELTSESESHGFSPLHLAASRKNIDMVKVLLAANSNVCSMTDKEGRTPLHLAAMKGHIEAMKELISTCPGAIQVVADRGETILHLCVKHNRLEALKLLLEELNKSNKEVLEGSSSSSSSSISINSKDADGNTILHLAVAKKHWEMITFLLDNNESSTKGIEVNALNKSGFTSLDVLLIQSTRDLKDIEILKLLSGAGCVRAANSSGNNISALPLKSDQERILKTVPTTNIDDESPSKWLKQTRNSLMVVASLIATMAFQSGLSPPGGFWESDSAEGPSPIKGENNIPAHHSGKVILAATNHGVYSIQVFFNTIGFLASFSIILLLISELPLVYRRSFVRILAVIMWIAITSMTFSYCVILNLTREHGSRATGIVIMVWMGLMFLIIVWHFFRFLRKCCCKNRPTELYKDETSASLSSSSILAGQVHGR